MQKNRVEAFSDGVIAIIITIMVLELKVPHGDELAALKPILPVFLSYVLSFIYVGIYWNNHHHMFHVTQRVSGRILWANLRLLFWPSGQNVDWDSAPSHSVLEPRTALALLSLAALLFAAASKSFNDHNFDRAEHEFAEFALAYTNSPLLAEALLHQGQARYHLKNFDGASQLLSSSLKTAGKLTDDYYLWLGQIAMARGGNRFGSRSSSFSTCPISRSVSPSS